MKKPKVKRVRIVQCGGRPHQLRYQDATGRQVRVSTGTRDDREAQRQLGGLG